MHSRSKSRDKRHFSRTLSSGGRIAKSKTRGLDSSEDYYERLSQGAFPDPGHKRFSPGGNHAAASVLLVIGVVVALVATLAILGTAVAQKASVPKRQDKLALGEDEVKQLLLLMDTDKNGKISKTRRAKSECPLWIRQSGAQLTF
jgi:hypothetical protein